MIEHVKTAIRTLSVFEAFARRREPLSLSELAKAIDSPVSSTHAVVKTLRARGFLYVMDERKLIYPTKRLLMIAQQIALNDPVLELAAPILAHLQAETHETLILGKRQDDHILYLDVLESGKTIRYSARPGDTKPMHSSSIGKAMLSRLPDDEIRALCDRVGQKPVTDTTITRVDDLIDDIRAGRERGVFTTRGENVVDVMALAIPLVIGGETFGIAIAGPLQRIALQEERCVGLLADAYRQFEGIEGSHAFG